MKTIEIKAEVESVREIGDSIQVWVYVGDYNVCVYLTREEAIKQGLI